MDDLYDLFEMNHQTPTKYVMVQKQDEMSFQQKLFRKAFYENSQAFQDTIVFVEISNTRICRKVGLTSTDQIVIVQNKNPFSELPVKFNVLNLDLERTEPLAFLENNNINDKFAEYLKEFSQQEMHSQFMFSDDSNVNLFQQFLNTLKSLVLDEEIIYGQTKQGLRNLRKMLLANKDDVLFLNLRDSTEFAVREPKPDVNESQSKFEIRKEMVQENRRKLLDELKEVKKVNSDVKIVCTDVKEGA